jgi:hypothetical protein
MEPNVSGVAVEQMHIASQQARRAVERACASLDQENVALMSLSAIRTAAVITNCERRGALAVAQSAISQLAKAITAPSDAGVGLSVGVATASVIPKNFDPGKMIECATRCLTAARACGISAVKSIEV